MGFVSGSTKRPERRVAKNQEHEQPRDPGPPVQEVRSAVRELGGPIDLRARVATARGSASETSSSRTGSHMSLASRSASATGPFTLDSPWTRLADSLIGDVILSHAPGRRLLDLGYGSPEISDWVRERVGEHLSIVEKGALEQAPDKIVDASGFLPASRFLDSDGNLLIPEDEDEDEPILSLKEYEDASFDVVYCLRTFPHLGYDTESSERLGAQLLREAARVTTDGGMIFVQIANPRSLRGIVEGIRNPITVVSRRRMILGDRYGLTRWDTIPRFLRFLPPELEFVRLHGLGVLVPHTSTLQIPLFGRVLARLEWWLRDLAFVQRFGAQIVVVMRRVHRSATNLREPTNPEAISLRGPK